MKILKCQASKTQGKKKKAILTKTIETIESSPELAGHLCKEKEEKRLVSLKFTARTDLLDIRMEVRDFWQIVLNCFIMLL